MHTTKPQARTAEIIVQELPDETLVYDLKNHKAHCLNRTASLVWKSCDGKRSAAEIARLLAEQGGSPPPAEVVWLALRQLGERRLLEGKLTSPVMPAWVSRREVARKLGLAVAALPLVTSVLAPTAAQAQTIVTFACNCLTGPNAVSRLFIDQQTRRVLMLSYRGRDPQAMQRFRRPQGSPPPTPEEVEKIRQEMANAPEVDYFWRFSDYKTVGGLSLPHLLTRATGKTITEEWVIGKFKLNPSLKPDKFEKKDEKKEKK